MTAARPTWRWQLLDTDGRPLVVAVPPPEAASRFDAELWLGERWRVLRADGAASARLLHDDVLVSVVALRDHAW